MKQLYLCVAITCCCTLSTTAQDMTANSTAYSSPRSKNEVVDGARHEVPRQKPRQWKKEYDQVNGHIDRALLKKMTKTTEAIVALLKDSCLSEGAIIPSWHDEFFSEKRSLSPRMKFGLECRFQPSLFPDNAALKGNIENSPTIRILANDFAILFQDTLFVNGKIYQTLRRSEIVKNDCPYFEYPVINGDMPQERPGRIKLWLVTEGKDKLPYVPVTRKEYLEEAIPEVKYEKDRIIAGIKGKIAVRPANAQKAEKELAIAQISQDYSGVELQMRVRQFTESYKTDEDYLDVMIKKETVEVDTSLYLMDSLLKHSSADDLKRPAVVSLPAINFAGFEDSLADRNMLVHINPAYFDLSLSGEKPQCFIVCWSYDPSEPVAVEIDRQLNEKFDFNKLKALLGK